MRYPDNREYDELNPAVDSHGELKILYDRFEQQLIKKYGLKLDDIKHYTHAGWFPNDIPEMTQWARDRLNNHTNKVNQGVRVWKRVMGNDVEMPYDLREYQCVCGVKIIWNHILVDDPKAEEPEILIIGSECIGGFCNISMNSKCILCGDKINNSVSGKCKKCRNRRFCKLESCGKELPKYRRGDYCRDKCENPEQFCPTKGCGNKRKVWQRKMMPTCYTCYKKKPCKR